MKLIFCFSFILGAFGISADSLSMVEALDIAMRKNPLVSQATEEKLGAVQERNASFTEFLPSFAANYVYQSSSKTPFRNIGPVSIIMNYKHSHLFDISVTQPIFTGLAILSQYQMAKLGIEIKEVEKKHVELQLEKNVKVGYLQHLYTQKMQQVALDEFLQLSSHEKDASNFYNNQIIPLNDLLKSQVALANAKQEKAQANSDVKTSLTHFSTLLNTRLTSGIEFQEPKYFDISALSLKELYSLAKQHRPEIQAICLGLKKYDYAIQGERSGFYPHIYLEGKYEEAGKSFFESENIFINKNNTFLQLKMSWDFFRWGNTAFKASKISHQKKALEKELENVNNQVFFEVKQAFLQLTVAKENIDSAKTALCQAEENVRITNLQYQEQVTTSTEVLQANSFLTKAKANYYSSIYGYSIALARLEASVGKNLIGWE